MTDTAVEAVKPYADHCWREVAAVAADLESFSLLLGRWQRVQNLVSRETLSDFWRRHIADSLQLLPLLRPGDRTFLDLGSGGGLPAIPLAVAARGGPRQFILVEPNGRKASFLRAVARELALPVRVENCRSDELDPQDLPPIDIVTARALAPLRQLLAFAAPFFGPTTRAILHKGREHVDELAESRAAWHHDVVITKSVTDDGGVLLELTNLRSKNN